VNFFETQCSLQWWYDAAWQEWAHDDSQHQEAVWVQVHRMRQELLRCPIVASSSREPPPGLYHCRGRIRCHWQFGWQQSRLVGRSQWQKPPQLFCRCTVQPEQCLDHRIQSSGVCELTFTLFVCVQFSSNKMRWVEMRWDQLVRCECSLGTCLFW